MRSLIWKEWRENLKWATVPGLVIGGLMALLQPPPIMDDGSLIIFGLIAAGFGAVLGFLQVHAEARGDKRSVLLHRPLPRTRIFLAKASAGVGLYLLALGAPFALEIVFAATPGHIAEPFSWPMVLPWLADVLTGLVYYFAGMLIGLREARWYGSRCLGLAAGFFCSLLVWTLPEFWHALLAIGIVGGLVAVAAWGSFLTGGAYAPQPRSAKVALALTLLIGLSTLIVAGKLFVGIWSWSRLHFYHRLDRQGRIVLVHEDHWKLQSVTDLHGETPPELQGKGLNSDTLRETVAPFGRAWGEWPRIRSYRNTNRGLVKYGNASKPGSEEWWFVPAKGRLFGYDKNSKLLIGSFGPEGLAPPDAQPKDRFQGEIIHASRQYLAQAFAYLAFPTGVYTVDFRKRTLQTLFLPAAGETVRWATRWEDEDRKLSLAFIGTDQAIYVLDEAGSRLLSAPVAYSWDNYRVRSVGRLEGPPRYWVWYAPAWHLGLDALETMSHSVVEYDSSGHEVARREVSPRPGAAREYTPPSPVVEPSQAHALFGLAASPVETAVLAGTRQKLESEVRANNGTEIWLLLSMLFATTQFFIPGVHWLPSAHPGLVWGNAILMLLSATISAFFCFLLARRYAFSRARCFQWGLCGFLFGLTGLLLMVSLYEWPARIACPKCGKLRVVTRDACEHCGAAHAMPAEDGTEIFEEAAITLARV